MHTLNSLQVNVLVRINPVPEPNLAISEVSIYADMTISPTHRITKYAGMQEKDAKVAIPIISTIYRKIFVIRVLIISNTNLQRAIFIHITPRQQRTFPYIDISLTVNIR